MKMKIKSTKRPNKRRPDLYHVEVEVDGRTHILPLPKVVAKDKKKVKAYLERFLTGKWVEEEKAKREDERDRLIEDIVKRVMKEQEKTP